MPPLTLDERDLIYALRYEEPVKDWADIYPLYPNYRKEHLRQVAHRVRKKKGLIPSGVPTPRIEGVTIAEGDDVDEDEIWRLALQKAEKRQQLEERKRDNRITFDRGPVCLVFVADQHAGSTGTDYARIERDAQVINDTPGMYSVAVGDIVDNFIIGKLKQIRLGTEFSVTQEWVLAKRVLRLMAPKLIASISGNHDLWTYALTGIDYLKEIHRELNPDILYAKYDMAFVLAVGANEYKIRARHKWRGHSEVNATHGIEKAAKFDKGRDFDVGVGAHTHASGLCRGLNNGGKTSHAVLCGSYKIYDDYPERLGLPEPNESAAVAMIFSDNPEHIPWGTNCLAVAADYMRTMYKDG